MGFWTDETTAQAQPTAISSDIAGKDAEVGVGDAQCAVTKVGLGNQVEVVGQLEGGEVEPSSPMRADVRVPELDQMEPSLTAVPLLGLSRGPKAGGSPQVSRWEATHTLPPPGVPDNAGTCSLWPIWEGEVKEEKEDVQTRVPEVLPATSGSSQPIPGSEDQKIVPDVETQVPKRPPAEVEVLVRTYTSGFPVILVATRSVIHKKWRNLRVPEECEYVYLGCFSVQGVQVRFILWCVKVSFLTRGLVGLLGTPGRSHCCTWAKERFDKGCGGW